jgi:hypothetical protein
MDVLGAVAEHDIRTTCELVTRNREEKNQS